MTEGEVERLREQFVVEYTYNSNAIEGNTLTLHETELVLRGLTDGNGRTGRLLVNMEFMKVGFPPIDIKFADRIAYYNAFDEYHIKHNLSAMEKLFAKYVILTKYVKALHNNK